MIKITKFVNAHYKQNDVGFTGERVRLATQFLRFDSNESCESASHLSPIRFYYTARRIYYRHGKDAFVDKKAKKMRRRLKSDEYSSFLAFN